MPHNCSRTALITNERMPCAIAAPSAPDEADIMNTLLWILSVLLVIIGLVGIIVPALPGPVLVFAGLVLAAWIDGFTKVGWLPLVALGLLTGLSLAADLIATGKGAKKAGASRQAVIGATIGTLVGIFFGIIGIFAGPFLGAAAGEFLANRDLVKAGKAGYGTLFGLVLGSALKIALALTMIGVFVMAWLVD
jgi:uncharacterized protein YqgC (DUF456 family)